MRLVVVYGLKTRDYRWLEGFYPAKRLTAACENRGLELRFLFPQDIRAFIDNPNDPKRDETVFFTRGDISREAMELLESTGLPCVNGLIGRDIANDKLRTFRFLSENGWPTPNTVALGNANGETPHDALGDTQGFPVVVKPRFGSQGRGVALCENVDDVDRAVGAVNAGTGAMDEWIAQEYIAHSRGRDLRMLFSGDEILTVAERRAQNGDFRSNAGTGGHFRLMDGYGPFRDMTLNIAKAAGLWYGSIDWLFLPSGSLTVCEINASPGFESIERDCGLDVAGKIVEKLLENFT
ncbi:MAG TPA: RimK family alpha-L-glutamate ligase [Treponemataceae bacterium]|nr:RimK family alpha-L-glutamate ligase [Treponemataceae bacterium]